MRMFYFDAPENGLSENVAVDMAERAEHAAGKRDIIGVPLFINKANLRREHQIKLAKAGASGKRK